MLLLEAAFLVYAFALAIPCTVFVVECVFGAIQRSRGQSAPSVGPRPRVAVLMPAHNERVGIGETLAALMPELGESDRLVVVADNCDDDTAAVARGMGATVVERSDTTRRGKGYALAFGLDFIAQDPPDVVVIMDADCAISPGGVEQLARLASTHNRPVQADYVLRPPDAASDIAVVSALAFIIKNRVRPRGLAALGLPCLLTGTGMGFPWKVIRSAPPTEGNLVEDMVMGLDLAELGYPPLLCPTACVTSVLPERLGAASAQRRRWEHGHLATLLTHGPRLLALGVRQRSVDLVALGLDLTVPPLSLLGMLVAAGLFGAVFAGLFGASGLPSRLMAANLGLIVTGVLFGWYAYGRETLRPRDLLAIPLYVAWKVPLYLAFLLRGRHGTWERTERRAPREDPPPTE